MTRDKGLACWIRVTLRDEVYCRLYCASLDQHYQSMLSIEYYWYVIIKETLYQDLLEILKRSLLHF